MEADFEHGKQASVELQRLIVKLLEDGLDPRSIGLVACGIGATMLIKHYGINDGAAICNGLIEQAAKGKLPVFEALQSANQNSTN